MFGRAWWNTIKNVFWEGVADIAASHSEAEAPQAIAVADAFTPQELSRLNVLRKRHHIASDCRAMDLDERRLGFARWLVEHGRIGEGVADS